MSTAQLKQQVGIAPTQTKPLTFPEILQSPKLKDQIAAALPRHLNPDRMIRIALTEFRKNKDLATCDPMTIVASIVVASQLGLEPGVLGQCYLIPYKGVCTLVPGWQGLVDLVSRAGRATVRTGAVRKGDHFDYEMGTSAYIKHTCTDDTDDDAPFTHVYAIGKVKGAEEPHIEVWSRKKVLSHLKRFNKQGDKHYATKHETNLEMYGRKVALLQVLKYLPKSVEIAQAHSAEYASEAGQTISVSEAVAGTFDVSGSYPMIEATEQPSVPWSQDVTDLFDKLNVAENDRERLYGECDADDTKLIEFLNTLPAR